MERVVVEAPATSANLGPGFDVFALALEKPVDRLSASASGSGKFRVRVAVKGGPGLSVEPERNSAGAVALSMGRKFRLKGDLDLLLWKGVPVGVGLGSSGASSAAAAVAVDLLYGLGLSTGEMVAHAGAGEKAASGAAHLDNVAGAILGGFVIVPRGPGAEPVTMATPTSLRVVVVTPKVVLPKRKTEYARSLVPKMVALPDLVWNVSKASMMVAGLARGDVGMIGEGMQDSVVEPARAKMVPGLDAVKEAAKKAGAAGTCISGAGPSVMSLVDRERVDPEDVLSGMVAAFRVSKIRASGFVTGVGKGAKQFEGP